MTLLRTSSFLALALTAGLVAACSRDTSSSRAPRAASSDATSSQTSNGLTRVDPSLVCMVNNRYMGKPQIAVEVQGKTYFGCCPMCKQRLVDEPAIRTAVDPVTGRSVDKASAVVAYDPAGHVLYFANAAELGRYRSQPR